MDQNITPKIANCETTAAKRHCGWNWNITQKKIETCNTTAANRYCEWNWNINKHLKWFNENKPQLWIYHERKKKSQTNPTVIRWEINRLYDRNLEGDGMADRIGGSIERNSLVLLVFLLLSCGETAFWLVGLSTRVWKRRIWWYMIGKVFKKVLNFCLIFKKVCQGLNISKTCKSFQQFLIKSSL